MERFTQARRVLTAIQPANRRRAYRDESLEDSANLPDPHLLAAKIADDLRSALEQIESVLVDLQARVRVDE